MDRAGALTGRSRAQQEVIGAVRGFARDHLAGPEVAVAVSGGADSLALTAAAVRAGLTVTGLVVDHQLQDGSAATAAWAAATAVELGAQARVLTVRPDGPGGPEAAARRARYDALEQARGERPVLLGHTLDDQAETVLLGLGRGSGARSLSGMAPWAAPWGRPLLGVRRATTRQACADWGLAPWQDPHNADRRYARVRVRHDLLPRFEKALGGGVASALARTADQLRADDAALTEWADRVHADVCDGLDLAVDAAAALPGAVGTRVLRRWLAQVGATEPTAAVVAQVWALIVDWSGQGPVAIGGDAERRLVVRRSAGLLRAEYRPR
ncbi:tRNA lysidine(34) synthetase TilS [Gordonia alkaliphila]|uniref:tRNA lysidine(34) synthetase TilS n=1 Tax=Gordonia alkaliphila TaxID=1053547 RepID=UPI001FF683F6|nr:tRNA lysidine(34) synthetase TilS [Gordonia alkaliphila]MCK0439442.1 tRNA lysidine(34) synthetase TilS [Gordonia alkaliphila]